MEKNYKNLAKNIIMIAISDAVKTDMKYEQKLKSSKNICVYTMSL